VRRFVLNTGNLMNEKSQSSIAIIWVQTSKALSESRH
jgi:hypothetical protein